MTGDGDERSRPEYDAEDLSGWDPEEKLGTPGSYPFTRGPYPSMYTERPWTIRQYAGYGDATATNSRFRALLDAGQTGLSVAFDLPTQMGYDSDDEMASGEVGKVGVAVDSIADMRALFAGIPLAEVTTSMTINSTAAILLLLYELVATEQGVSPDRIGGDRAKRHPQGVHRQGDVHLSTSTVDAPGDRPLCLLRRRTAKLEHHFDQRVSHPRGRLHGCSGDSIHDRRRARLCRGGEQRRARHRSVRPAAFVFSGTPTTAFSKKSPNTGRRAVSGPASCAIAQVRPSPSRGGCASIPKRRGRRSRRSSR